MIVDRKSLCDVLKVCDLGVCLIDRIRCVYKDTSAFMLLEGNK